MQQWNYLLILAGLALTQPALGSTTICKVDGGPFAPTVISWNTKSGKASLKTRFGNATVESGAVVLVRDHDGGKKINLRFNHYGVLSKHQDMFEFVVFPAGGEYRIIGVGYVESNGKYYFDVSLGNWKAHCQTL